ncbi:MAG: hypothetical protein ACYDGO_04070 [Smithellaceae bacterium]
MEIDWPLIFKFCQDTYPIVNIIIAILWGVYVYFTIKTFREIKRQTDLQSEAFLIVACQTIDSVPIKTINKIGGKIDKSHDKWTEIVKTHIPGAVGPASHLTLTLTNKGRSDIISWKIIPTLSIKPGNFLAKKFNTSGETISWEIKSNDRRDIIGQGESITIEIAKVGAYPEAELFWAIEYTDMRNKTYKTFSGDKSKTVTNALALDMKE